MIPHFDEQGDLPPAEYSALLGSFVGDRVRVVAIPAISTGIYGYPQDQAAEVASRTILEFLQTDESLREIRLVFYTQAAAEVFLRHQVFS